MEDTSDSVTCHYTAPNLTQRIAAFSGSLVESA